MAKISEAIADPVQLGWRRGDDRDLLLTREWLVTNGLGGYATGTIGGVCTRRFHGMLIAALRAPAARTVMLNHIEEVVEKEDDRPLHRCLAPGAPGRPRRRAKVSAGLSRSPLRRVRRNDQRNLRHRASVSSARLRRTGVERGGGVAVREWFAGVGGGLSGCLLSGCQLSGCRDTLTSYPPAALLRTCTQ